MSSCAASSCTCFPKALSASVTLASLPIAAAPLSYRSACNFSVHYHYRRLNQKPLWSNQEARCGCVLNAVAPWSSSRDLLPPSCSSVRHPLSPEPPHETTIPASLTRCLSPPAGIVRSSCPQASH